MHAFDFWKVLGVKENGELQNEVELYVVRESANRLLKLHFHIFVAQSYVQRQIWSKFSGKDIHL